MSPEPFDSKTASETAELALGGLLHDVGKLLERACRPGAGLSSASENLESELCPVWNGDYTHKHVLYTWEFFEWLEREAVFWPDGLNLYRTRGLACYHHNPDTPERKLIAEADRLSAGLDREGEDTKARIRRTRLLSPLSAADGDFDRDWATAPRLNPVPFSAQAAYPAPAPEDDLTPGYAKLLAQFQKAWAANKCPDPLGYVNRAVAVLEHFAWAAPSAVNARPDISLFDHLKTTAALAVADHYADDRETPFLLLLGGLHGVQKHILAVKEGQGGLARRLRARSFQVSAYALSVELELLRLLALPLTQSLFRAGGKFALLLPNNARTRAIAAETRPRLAEWLYKNAGARLTLSLTAYPVGREDMRVRFPERFSLAQARQERERRREAHDLLLDEQGWREAAFIPPLETPKPGQGLCPACALHPAGEDERSGLCPACLGERELGGRLPGASLVVFQLSGGRGAYPAPAGSFDLLPAGEIPPPGAALVGALDGYEPMLTPAAPLTGRPQARGIPEREGRPLEFDQLAELAQGRLGCLKVDVDNLGLLFQADRRSISRTAALSRSLEAFFSLGVKTLTEAEFPNIYLLYAGGDDLAAVGPWDDAFDFAARLREEFRRYIGGGSRLTLSAGLAVVPRRRPVTAALAEAEVLLQSSKRAAGRAAIPLPLADKQPGEPEKDRCGAFGVSLPWPDFAAALDEAKRLAGWLKDNVVSTGQARRLLGYAEKFAQYQKTGETRYFEYAPLLNRDVNRNWRGGAPEAEESRRWAATLACPDQESRMGRLGFVCRYALTANRRLRNEE